MDEVKASPSPADWVTKNIGARLNNLTKDVGAGWTIAECYNEDQGRDGLPTVDLSSFHRRDLCWHWMRGK